MELDAVRGLKRELAEEILPQATESTDAHMAARSVRRRGEAVPAIALGIALGVRGGYALAVRLQHRWLVDNPIVARITARAAGEVDIRYVGRVEKDAEARQWGNPEKKPWRQQRRQPLRMGTSISHINVTYGTLGAFVRPRGGGPLCVLSNNHVLANENNAKKGDPVVQPGRNDGGRDPEHRVARLLATHRLKRKGTNSVDCAMAEIDADIATDPSRIPEIGTLKGVRDTPLEKETDVAKFG